MQMHFVVLCVNRLGKLIFKFLKTTNLQIASIMFLFRSLSTANNENRSFRNIIIYQTCCRDKKENLIISS